MMPSLMTRLKASDLFFSRLPFIDEILYENFDAPALTYPRVFDVRSSSRAFEETTGFSGFGLFSQKEQDGGAIDYDTIFQLYDQRSIHATYAKGFQISEEGQEDDIDGVISNAAPAMGRAAQVSIETVIWNVLNNGFASQQSPDGVALFHNSHPQVDGTTQDNLASGDFATATLEAAITQFDDLKDERGLPIELQPAVLCFPTALRWQVVTVLKSENRPGTANNDINTVNNLGLLPVMSKYITDSDSWFLGAPANQAKLLVYWRKEPVSDHVLDFETGNMKSKMTYRMSTAVADWRGWVASPGA
jgi:Mu-like prophage major head subunit gpT